MMGGLFQWEGLPRYHNVDINGMVGDNLAWVCLRGGYMEVMSQPYMITLLYNRIVISPHADKRLKS